MRPTHANESFSARELELFEEVRRNVECLPNEWPDISCHELSRAVGLAFCLSWIDGHWLGSFEHSWVQVPNTDHLIDVYPIGHAGWAIRPVLVDYFVAKHHIRFGTQPTTLYDARRLPDGVKRVRDDMVQAIRQKLVDLKEGRTL